MPHRITKAYGAPIPAEIDRIFREEFGVPVMLEGYGMTEIPGACNNPFPGAGLGEMRLGSMGKPARHPDHSMPFAELRVVDDDGRDLPVGATGELAVRTPIIMKGYYRDPEATKAAFRDGWFLTGDLVRRDADGYFWFVARKKDIIRRRGENISGAELDRVIGEHSAVAEAAAIAVPSPLGEDDILVAVVLRPGMQATAQEIADWCRARLAAHKVPALRHLRRRAAAHADAPRREVQAQGRQDAGRARRRPRLNVRRETRSPPRRATRARARTAPGRPGP